MNLPKAIEICTELKDAGIDAGHYDAEDAIQLLIEAGKAWELHQACLLAEDRELLPGETEE